MTDTKQLETLRFAEAMESLKSEVFDFTPIGTELRRLLEVNQMLVETLKGLDEAYCRAGSPLTKEERQEDRMRLIYARLAISKAEVTK